MLDGTHVGRYSMTVSFVQFMFQYLNTGVHVVNGERMNVGQAAAVSSRMKPFLPFFAFFLLACRVAVISFVENCPRTIAILNVNRESNTFLKTSMTNASFVWDFLQLQVAVNLTTVYLVELQKNSYVFPVLVLSYHVDNRKNRAS
jgi:hypothetical protein